MEPYPLSAVDSIERGLDRGWHFPSIARSQLMSLGTILIIVLVLVLLGVFPSWGYSNGWGYGPSGVVGTVLVVILVLLVLGKI
jgi:hypothetical protein